MRKNIVVAMASNRVIGRDGGLPWRLPADLRHFKAITMDYPIVMGRKTHDSIGRALPGRLNIVVSRDPNYTPASDCKLVDSLESAAQCARPAVEMMIIGGAGIYTDALADTQRIFLTEVHAEVHGDTFFPKLDGGWRETARERFSADVANEYDYSFVTLERTVATKAT